MPVLRHEAESEEAGADDEGGSNEVAVDRIGPGTRTSLDLDGDAQVVVECANLIRHTFDALVAEEDRPADLVCRALSCLDGVAELRQAISEQGQHAVARQILDPRRVDQLLLSCEQTDEVESSLGWSVARRVEETTADTQPSSGA